MSHAQAQAQLCIGEGVAATPIFHENHNYIVVMVCLIASQGCLFDIQTVLDYGQSILSVAQALVKSLIEHRPLTTKFLQSQMNRHFHGTAAEGKWQWKDGYEAVEVALIGRTVPKRENCTLRN